MSDIKLFKLRFKTANKTVDEVKASYGPPIPPQEILEKITEAYRALDGCEVTGGAVKSFPKSYSVYGWNKEDDSKFKEFIYLQEQDELFGSYINDREQFETDWDSKEYEPPASMHFDKSDFEVIEEIPILKAYKIGPDRYEIVASYDDAETTAAWYKNECGIDDEDWKQYKVDQISVDEQYEWEQLGVMTIREMVGNDELPQVVGGSDY